MNAMSANDVKVAKQKGTWKKAHKKQSKLSLKERGLWLKVKNVHKQSANIFHFISRQVTRGSMYHYLSMKCFKIRKDL